jgi:hypothetical protein
MPAFYSSLTLCYLSIKVGGSLLFIVFTVGSEMMHLNNKKNSEVTKKASPPVYDSVSSSVKITSSVFKHVREDKETR